MNPLVKKKWLEALRSDKYEQTATFLFDRGSYCCLGVLADLYFHEKGYQTERLTPDAYTCLMFENSLDEQGQMPSETIQDWAELCEGDCADFASLNDKGDSFNKIADYIEERY